MMVVAHKDGLFRIALPKDMVRFGVVAAAIPVIVFLGSIPLATIDTRVALYSWILIIPLEWLTDRLLRPDNAHEYL